MMTCDQHPIYPYGTSTSRQVMRMKKIIKYVKQFHQMSWRQHTINKVLTMISDTVRKEVSFLPSNT